ncbi:XdhC family protein [Methylophaga thiooxydans]|uniref:XdhC family protein n=1 Tax=Methylophaga thiooxydans TaxID=392484 RepID=UPI0023558489|nr:XdhC family protein [Methylophaga thiooxydans]
MQSTDITVLKQAQQWLTEGHSVWLSTVLKTYGSSPRQPGAMCAIREDGALVGSVSGGCIEDDLKDKALQGALTDDEIVFLTYGESVEERDRFRLPCGGTLRLAVEKITDARWLNEVLAAIEHGQQVKRRVSLHSRENVIETVSQFDKQVEEQQNQLAFIYGPRARLLLIGAGETSSYLAKMASALDYHVMVAEPREDMQLTWQSDDGELLAMMPDDAVIKIKPDFNTSIITLTHDPKLDDMALLEALKSDAFYIGALGSSRTNAKRRERLAMFDLTQEQISRLHGPVGLDIGSKTPAEIAVSILAELVKLKQSQQHQLQHPKIRAVS